jgi:hypothetical protein
VRVSGGWIEVGLYVMGTGVGKEFYIGERVFVNVYYIGDY